ncbi:MAG: DUF3431 domain-containing protein [Desulfovibrionaceae bacterium]|jgi:hypothetical protein|nr:DUF3431 domain-containing protein [Desulfovibrionaceae bacterium]
MSAPPIQLVIARYQEDVSWVAAAGHPAVVYDKSGTPPAPADLGLGPDSNVVPLPNVGRETHTYLTHILSEWDRLAEVTVFCQGDPFAHMAPGTGPAEFGAAIAAYAEKRTPFKGFAFYTLRCDGLGRPHHLREEASRGKWAGWGRDIPVAEVYARLFAGPVPGSFHARAPAGLFLVRRERIRLRPRALYETALRLVLDDPDDARNTGHAFERLWYLIFNGYAPLNPGPR